MSTSAAYQKEKAERIKDLKEKAGIATPAVEKSLARKVMESDLYEWKPTAILLLNQLAVLAMSEDSNYPEDAPDEFRADKEGWCWMTQRELATRCRCDESTIYRWIKRFRADGVILYRDWHDDNKTHHSEYKVVESVLDTHQRRKGAERPPRYKEKRKANRGSFTTANQPGVSVIRRGIREEDGE